MLQATLAGFCGGLVGHQCSNCELPNLRCGADETAAFRLSVRVLSASVPALAEPGLFHRQRPRAEVSLRESRKETEFAEFASGYGTNRRLRVQGLAACGEAAPSAATAAFDCPWHFGDTLVFTACLADVRGPGLRLRLRSHSDIRLGPVQLELARIGDLGSCMVDLRRKVLPACIPERQCGGRGLGARRGDAGGGGDYQVWESPVLVIPLVNDSGVAAHVAVTFGVTSDPELLLRLASDAERPLAEKMVRPLRLLVEDQGWANCATEPGTARCSFDSESSDSPEPHSAWQELADMEARNVGSFCTPLRRSLGSSHAVEAAPAAAAGRSGPTGDRAPRLLGLPPPAAGPRRRRRPQPTSALADLLEDVGMPLNLVTQYRASALRLPPEPTTPSTPQA